MSETSPAPSAAEPVVYRFHMAVVARMVGAAVVALALLVFAGTVVVALTDLPTWVLVALVGLGAVAIGVLALVLRRVAWVLRCDETGYRVRMVRGAGVAQARWSDVTDAVAVTRGGVPCVSLRLRDGSTTTIPVTVLDVDREQLARELQRHLQRGQRAAGR